MNESQKQLLYDYIDERLKVLSDEEIEARNNYAFDVVQLCVAKKCELLDMKLFIQAQ